MRYQTKKILVSLESIALTDIVMNMFIFFFITFSLIYVPAMKEKAIKVDLPKAKTGADRLKKGLVISITKKDPEHVYLNEESVPINALGDKLKAVLAASKDEPITLKCDRTVYVDNMVKIMDIARSVGALRLNIAIEPALSKAEDCGKPAKSE